MYVFGGYLLVVSWGVLHKKIITSLGGQRIIAERATNRAVWDA